MSWERCPVKRFKNSSFDDDMKPTSKARLAKETSDLQSEVEGGVSLNKRKISRPSWNSTDDESSDAAMLPSLPSRKRVKIATAPREASPSLPAHNRMDTHPAPPIEICSRCSNHAAALKSMQEQIRLLRALMTDVLKEVRNANEVAKPPTESNRRALPFFARFEELNFPLRTYEELTLLETILEDKRNFEDAVEELHKTGGDGSYNFARRALAVLMTDELALCFSWLGRQGKKSFKSYRTANLVLCAADKANIAGSRKTHERSVQLWLKRATDRKKRVAKLF